MCPCPRPAGETVATMSAEWTLVVSFPEEGRGGEERRGGKGVGEKGRAGQGRGLGIGQSSLIEPPAATSPLHTSSQGPGTVNLQDPVFRTFLPTNSSVGLLRARG